MGFPDDVEMRDRLRAIGCVDEKTQLIITHFSHNGKLLHEELEALAAPKGFRVAYDGAIFEIQSTSGTGKAMRLPRLFALHPLILS